jgi:hypothetical protein
MENQVALEKENNAGVLYLAFELSHKRWKLGFSDGRAPQVRQVTRRLSIKLCLTAGSSSVLKARLEHGIELRQRRVDAVIGGPPLSIFKG